VIPVAPPASRVPLRPGDQACCLLLEVVGRRSRSGTRQAVRGVARVLVESIEGDVCHVVVLAASGGRVGEQLTFPRAALYSTQGDEWRAFKELVGFFWGRNR
jgi:hypothetical protein